MTNIFCGEQKIMEFNLHINAYSPVSIFLEFAVVSY